MIRQGLPKTVRPHIWNSYLCLAKSLCVFGPSCSHGDKGNVLGSAEFCHPMSLYHRHQPKKKSDKPKWSQRFCQCFTYLFPSFHPSYILSFLPSLLIFTFNHRFSRCAGCRQSCSRSSRTVRSFVTRASRSWPTSTSGSLSKSKDSFFFFSLYLKTQIAWSRHNLTTL